MTLFRRTVVMVAGLSGPWWAAEGQSELIGRVVTDSGRPVPGATVTVTPLRYSVKADSLGRFRLAGTPGSTLSLTFAATGFRDENASVVLQRGRPTMRDFILVSDGSAPIVNPSDKVLRVRVTTEEGEPIAYANLQVNGGRRFVSNDTGHLAVPVSIEGRATLLFRRIGFEPTEITLDGMPDTAVMVRMKAVARTLDAQVVTVRSPFVRLDLGGFYKRMAEVENGARVGYFMTPEDLAIRRPQGITDAVEHFPNIRLAPIDDGVVDAFGLAHADGMPVRRKFRIEDRNGCPLTVYLDRVRIQPNLRGGKAVDEEINSLINPASVAGIEVYPRAMGAPPEFPAVNTNTVSMCGVVLIWTK